MRIKEMTLQDKMNKLFAAGFTVTTDGKKTTFTKTVEGDLNDAIDNLLNTGFVQTNSPIHEVLWDNYCSALVPCIKQLFGSKHETPPLFAFACKFGCYEVLRRGDLVYLINKFPTAYDSEKQFAEELHRVLPSEYYIADIINNTIRIAQAA
nr:MAG: hypothetical protein [Bacteriophage sp.]